MRPVPRRNRGRYLQSGGARAWDSTRLGSGQQTPPGWVSTWSISRSQRRILLVDCDAFFVQVARLEDPEGVGKAKLLIVGRIVRPDAGWSPLPRTMRERSAYARPCRLRRPCGSVRRRHGRRASRGRPSAAGVGRSARPSKSWHPWSRPLLSTSSTSTCRVPSGCSTGRPSSRPRGGSARRSSSVPASPCPSAGGHAESSPSSPPPVPNRRVSTSYLRAQSRPS